MKNKKIKLLSPQLRRDPRAEAVRQLRRPPGRGAPRRHRPLLPRHGDLPGGGQEQDGQQVCGWAPCGDF